MVVPNDRQYPKKSTAKYMEILADLKKSKEAKLHGIHGLSPVVKVLKGFDFYTQGLLCVFHTLSGFVGRTLMPLITVKKKINLNQIVL